MSKIVYTVLDSEFDLRLAVAARTLPRPHLLLLLDRLSVPCHVRLGKHLSFGRTTGLRTAKTGCGLWLAAPWSDAFDVRTRRVHAFLSKTPAEYCTPGHRMGRSYELLSMGLGPETGDQYTGNRAHRRTSANLRHLSMVYSPMF